jgi:hypothetical protein
MRSKLIRKNTLSPKYSRNVPTENVFPPHKFTNKINLEYFLLLYVSPSETIKECKKIFANVSLPARRKIKAKSKSNGRKCEKIKAAKESFLTPWSKR